MALPLIGLHVLPASRFPRSSRPPSPDGWIPRSCVPVLARGGPPADGGDAVSASAASQRGLGSCAAVAACRRLCLYTYVPAYLRGYLQVGTRPDLSHALGWARSQQPTADKAADRYRAAWSIGSTKLGAC